MAFYDHNSAKKVFIFDLPALGLPLIPLPPLAVLSIGDIQLSTEPLNRPFHSRIQLNKHPDKLEIVIPPREVRRFAKVIDPDFWLQERLVLYNISRFVSEVPMMILGVLFLVLLIILILINSPWLLILFLLIKVYILYITQTEVYMNTENLQLLRYAFGFTYNSKSSTLNQIEGVMIKNKNSINEVIIKTFNNVYFIGDALREDECLWLVQEIENWLSTIATDE